MREKNVNKQAEREIFLSDQLVENLTPLLHVVLDFLLQKIYLEWFLEAFTSKTF